MLIQLINFDELELELELELEGQWFWLRPVTCGQLYGDIRREEGDIFFPCCLP